METERRHEVRDQGHRCDLVAARGGCAKVVALGGGSASLLRRSRGECLTKWASSVAFGDDTGV